MQGSAMIIAMHWYLCNKNVPVVIWPRGTIVQIHVKIGSTPQMASTFTRLHKTCWYLFVLEHNGYWSLLTARQCHVKRNIIQNVGNYVDSSYIASNLVSDHQWYFTYMSRMLVHLGMWELYVMVKTYASIIFLEYSWILSKVKQLVNIILL